MVAANALLAAAFEVPIVSASASPSASLETKCQCLVVDESRLVPDTSDFREFRQAMDSSADRVALLGYVRQWLRDTPHDDLIVAHVPHGPRESAKLHINFASFEALGRALARFPFLVRCGSMGTVSSWNTTPCGLPRHECPEMLSFSVNTLTQGNPKDLDREVTRLLKEMDVDYTAMWFTSATILAGSNSNRKAWSVLVRRVDKLSELVHRLHHHHTLWGGKIRVHAPNSPKLIRCTQCDQLGHHVNKCTIYDGLAVRFLFKETASYHAVQQLVKMVGARAGFLGSGMEEVKPSRRVTLLFDAAEKDLSVIIGRVREVAGGLALHVNPYAVDVKDRQRECRECGDMTSPHECPFSNFKPKAMSHVLNIASRSLEQKDMCHAWFTDKFCPRRDRGDPCPFKHPPEHVAQSGTRACHQFRANGHCSRGASCPLKHAAATVAAAAVSPPVASAVSPVVAAEPPATAAVVAPAASPSKKRRAKAVEEDEESKDAVVPSSAKKSRQVATRTLTKVTPKSSGGRFAALQASSDDAMDDDDAESKSPPPPRTPPTARRTMSSSSGRAAPSSTPISSLGSISSPQPSPSRTSSSTKKNKPSSSAASSQ